MSPALKSMCAKIALERSRPAQWRAAKELRIIVRTKLEALVLAGQARARALARFPSLS